MAASSNPPRWLLARPLVSERHLRHCLRYHRACESWDEKRNRSSARCRMVRTLPECRWRLGRGHVRQSHRKHSGADGVEYLRPATSKSRKPCRAKRHSVSTQTSARRRLMARAVCRYLLGDYWWIRGPDLCVRFSHTCSESVRANSHLGRVAQCPEKYQ